MRRAATAPRSARTGTNRTVSPGASWPSFQRSPPTTVTGQTKPPRLGPSGPSRIGVSPVKSSAPTQYALSWMFDGCSPASPPSVRAHCGFGPDQPHAGAVGVEVHRRSRCRRACRVRAGEELGRRVRPVGHRDLPARAPMLGLPSLRRERIGRAAVRRRRTGDQHVACAQRPAVVAAEPPEREGRPAARGMSARSSPPRDQRRSMRSPGPRQRADVEHAAGRAR